MAEQTREICIRLAIGARAREVLLQFLVEAVTLSCIGGVTGIILAYGLCITLAKVVGAPFLFVPKINSIAFIFSAAIGILFGFMPARRPASSPIKGLHPKSKCLAVTGHWSMQSLSFAKVGGMNA